MSEQNAIVRNFFRSRAAGGARSGQGMGVRTLPMKTESGESLYQNETRVSAICRCKDISDTTNLGLAGIY